MIIVTNGDMFNVKPITENVYKYDENVQRAFNLQCTPSIYVQQGEQFLVRELSIRKKDGKKVNP